MTSLISGCVESRRVSDRGSLPVKAMSTQAIVSCFEYARLEYHSNSLSPIAHVSN